jgi:hypothetical protein
MDIDSYNLDQSKDTKANPDRYPFLKSLDISEDVIRRLSLHLDRIVQGDDTVYLSALGKSKPPLVILNEWDKVYKLNERSLSKNLNDLELANRSKFSPRSISKPWSERVADVKNYFNIDFVNHKFENLSKFKFKSNSGLRPISLNNAISLIKTNTNSGLPYYTRKKNVVSKLENNFSELISIGYPCILFTRTQENNKTRTVWGYPVAGTVNELMYYTPLLLHQKQLHWRSSLIGPDEVDKSISNMFSVASVNNDLNLISVDFSNYDSTVSYTLQKLAFDYIKSLYQVKYHDDIDNIFKQFNTIGLLTPDGIMKGRHGVPSGATFTNEVDSIAQFICSVSSNVNVTDFNIQGDDGVYLLNRSDNDEFIKGFKENGLLLNIEKSHISNDYCIYLQRLYDKFYFKNGFVGGIYPIYRALNRILYQERYSDFEDFNLNGIDYYSIRTITILENVKYHPLFKTFVKFIYDLDKYKLKFSSESIDKYNNMLSNGPGTGGLLYNQFGDNVKGIKSFESYKIIKELRGS